MSDAPDAPDDPVTPGDETDASDGEPRIRELDERTIQRIAAGEVVERPASVVKELVENSLDAGASRVAVAVDRGGTEGISVRDDGRGMTGEEVRAAVREHTTSKIADIDDLEAGVGTLGFRGEALSTIGAVSRMNIRTKPHETDGAGSELRVEGGDVTGVEPTGCPAGTTVEVDDLFFNTPARRKFLKTTATEFDHVNAVVTHYALANPDVAVSLEHDGREVFATEGRGSLASTVLSVYGREVAESMIPVEFDPEVEAIESVEGLVSHPETNRSARDYLSTFVNGRYVTARALREAVLDAYGGQLAADRYPFAVLFVRVPPETVDVNVHPRKMEVRFDDEAAVRGATERAVEDALLEAGLVRSSAPRGRSAPEETPVRPERDDLGRDDAESDSREESPDATGPSEAESASTRDGDVASEASESESDDGDPERDRLGDPEVEFDAVDDGAGGPADDPDAAPADGGATSGGADVASGEIDAEPAPTGDTSGEGNADERADAVADRPSGSAGGRAAESAVDGRGGNGAFTGPHVQRTLDREAAGAEPALDRLPRLRVLGQLFETYLVAETDDGMVLVDQHAADERVNYERLREQVAGDTPTQALASPVELELTARETELFEEYREALAQVGFHAGRTGERTVEVRTVPAVVDAALDPELLRDALGAFVRDRDGGRETVDAVADSLLADLACYPSITGNTSLREGSVVELLEALDDCDNPYACPHGRPVIVEFERGEIEDRFERDYPGHAGRRRE